MRAKLASPDEVEITPEMIEAGADELAGHYLALVDASGYPEIARTVYEAMAAVRPARAPKVAGTR
jgi:hypothetical protein